MTRLSLPTFFLCWICIAAAQIAAAQVTIDPSPQAVLGNKDSSAITAPAGATSLIPFTADPTPAGGDMFDVVTSNPSVVISLLLPSGAEITSANAATQGFAYTVIPDGTFSKSQFPSSFASAGTHTVIQLSASLPPGSYQIKASAAGVTTDTLVIATYYSTSSVHAGLLTVSPVYRIGDTVVVNGLLFDGSSGMSGATASANVADLSDTTAKPVTVPLLDSGTMDAAAGDGIYTGTYTATKAGKFTASMRASGLGSGGPFSRAASTTFRVIPPYATFTSFSDRGVLNSNGKINPVVVDALVNVQAAGSYQFAATLVASTSASIKASQIATLATGAQHIAVSFPAADVVGLGVNGPYTIKQATLLYGGDPDIPVVDYRDTVGNTTAYQISLLDLGDLFFTGQNTAAGVDTNGNGKFDILRVQAGLSVTTAGSYQWSASLASPSGNQLDFFSGSATLTTGTNTINFDFAGSKVGASCTFGRYSVISVLLYGPSGTGLVIPQLFQTQFFTSQQFENSSGCPPAPAQPSVTAAGITNGASFTAGLVAGGIVTIFGKNLSTGTTGIVGAAAVPLPTSLPPPTKATPVTTSVTVNGLAAPLFAIANVSGQEQINLQVPFEVAGQGTASIIVNNNGAASAPISVPILDSQPGIFLVGGQNGAILHGADSSLVATGNPAAKGEVVVLFATSLGQVTPTLRTNQAASSSPPLSTVVAVCSVTVGGLAVKADFCGLAPGFIGLYQVNFAVPPNAASGSDDVVLKVGSQTSNTVKMAVQ